jgi:hypothetical protein
MHLNLRKPDEVGEVIVDEARSKRIQDKYKRLVDQGLYQDNDMRSFSNHKWVAIVHFNDKTIYVLTYPIVSVQPDCYIKTCACGTVIFKEQLQYIVDRPVDIEDVLDDIQLVLNKPNTDFDGDPAVANPHANTQQHKEMV